MRVSGGPLSDVIRRVTRVHALRSRQMAWHYAMTRQTLTYDSFFNESILDQGTAYRYDMGARRRGNAAVPSHRAQPPPVP